MPVLSALLAPAQTLDTEGLRPTLVKLQAGRQQLRSRFWRPSWVEISGKHRPVLPGRRFRVEGFRFRISGLGLEPHEDDHDHKSLALDFRIWSLKQHSGIIYSGMKSGFLDGSSHL